MEKRMNEHRAFSMDRRCMSPVILRYTIYDHLDPSSGQLPIHIRTIKPVLTALFIFQQTIRHPATASSSSSTVRGILLSSSPLRKVSLEIHKRLLIAVIEPPGSQGSTEKSA